MKYLYGILCMVLLFSCQNVDRTSKPDNLIPEQKMVDVLTELSLLNSAKNYNRRLLEETGLQPHEYLYEKFSIDSVTLAESTRYYARNQAQLEQMYNRVRDNLEAMKRDLEKIRQEEVRLRDSIEALEENGDSLRIRRGEYRTFPPDTLIRSSSLQVNEGLIE